MTNFCKPTFNLHANIAIHATSNHTPQIGEGATVCYAKDRHASTIISLDGKRQIITVQQDKATRTDNLGMSDSQDYSYERNLEGTTWSFKYKSGKWRECYKDLNTGRWKMYKHGNGLIIGIRDEFYDFTF